MIACPCPLGESCQYPRPPTKPQGVTHCLGCKRWFIGDTWSCECGGPVASLDELIANSKRGPLELSEDTHPPVAIPHEHGRPTAAAVHAGGDTQCGNRAESATPQLFEKTEEFEPAELSGTDSPCRSSAHTVARRSE